MACLKIWVWNHGLSLFVQCKYQIIQEWIKCWFDILYWFSILHSVPQFYQIVIRIFLGPYSVDCSSTHHLVNVGAAYVAPFCIGWAISQVIWGNTYTTTRYFRSVLVTASGCKGSKCYYWNERSCSWSAQRNICIVAAKFLYLNFPTHIVLRKEPLTDNLGWFLEYCLNRNVFTFGFLLIRHMDEIKHSNAILVYLWLIRSFLQLWFSQSMLRKEVPEGISVHLFATFTWHSTLI